MSAKFEDIIFELKQAFKNLKNYNEIHRNKDGHPSNSVQYFLVIWEICHSYYINPNISQVLNIWILPQFQTWLIHICVSNYKFVLYEALGKVEL